jgi:hypothetical protein
MYINFITQFCLILLIKTFFNNFYNKLICKKMEEKKINSSSSKIK